MGSKYYDGTKLLSLKDINGYTPEIYMVTTNRTGGKTTYFGRMVVNRFLKKGSKFALLYRFNYELDSIADKFFKDINSLFFPGYTMVSKRQASGIYHELFLFYPGMDVENDDPIPCGYALTLNSCDQLKKYSHLLSDIDSIIFDEFQSETNHYCAQEVQKFISLHTSIARGQGMQYKPVPVYMIANPVTILNPYYVEMDISSRLRENTRYLRGDGFVLEQGFVESASVAQKESAFNRAFGKNKYIAYSSESIYLNDSKVFIEKPSGIGRYLCTIRYNNINYAIREYEEEGVLYADNRPDMSYKYKIAVNTESHGVNYVMLKRNDMFIQNMRYFFERGCFRFKDLNSKEAILKLISY